jgi:hypothetical protein
MPDLNVKLTWEGENLWGATVEKAMVESDEAVLEADKKDASSVIKIREQNGKYYMAGQELNIDHLEEWGGLIVAEMAKRVLKK